jgi:hypothetical protein
MGVDLNQNKNPKNNNNTEENKEILLYDSRI